MNPLLRRRLTLLAMCTSQGMILLDITIVNIALPSLQRELHMSPGTLEWVISAYALTLATLIPIGGTLGDRLGRKRIFVAGLALFTLASACCALSTTAPLLITFRVAQGIGGAVMSALTLSILSETYPPDKRAGAIGLWAAVAGLGFGAGPIVGGLLLSVFDWQSIFWVNVPIGLAGLALSVIGVSESKDPVTRPIDLGGLVLSALGLFGVTLALVESSTKGWGSPVVFAPLATGVGLLVAFALWERHTPHPMAPPALLRTPSFGWSCLIYLLAYATLTAVMFFATLLFQDVKDWSALRTGLSWLTMNLPFLAMAQFAGRLHRRFPSSAVTGTGLFVAAAGILTLSQVTTSTPFALAGAGYVLLGLGYGTMTPAVATVAMSEVPLGASGVASGILNASRQVGTSVGLAVFGAIGVAAATSQWLDHVSTLPAAQRLLGHQLAQGVAGGQVARVIHQLGSRSAQAATGAFLHGYEVAVVASALLVALAGALALVGLRVRPSQGVVDPTIRTSPAAG